jgi:hypothetical protein
MPVAVAISKRRRREGAPTGVDRAALSLSASVVARSTPVYGVEARHGRDRLAGGVWWANVDRPP